jgi:anthranilate phosphoribosyltransferase
MRACRQCIDVADRQQRKPTRRHRSAVMATEFNGLLSIAGSLPADRRMAFDSGVVRLATTQASRTVILPTGDGVRRLPNLTALLAMLLVRFGVPVLLHGAAVGDAGRDEADHDAPNAGSSTVTTADVLSCLGIHAASSPAQVQADLARERAAYVATDILAPGLAARLNAQGGLSDSMLAKLIDPFGGASYRVVSVDRHAALAPMRALLAAAHADALLLLGCEGEPFTDPRRQVPLEDFVQGIATVVAGSADGVDLPPTELPSSTGASMTAAWVTRVLAGELPVPASILTQLSCCLIGARRPLSQPMGDV